MICESCQGTGYARNKHYIEKLPCPDCMGVGISYCCDDAGANPPNSHAAALTNKLPDSFWDSDLGKPFGDVNSC